MELLGKRVESGPKREGEQQLLGLGCPVGVRDCRGREVSSDSFLPPRYGGTLQNITLKLPITLNKFFQATEMQSQDFFQRWKQLSLYAGGGGSAGVGGWDGSRACPLGLGSL